MKNNMIELDRFEIIMSKIFIGIFILIAVINLFK